MGLITALHGSEVGGGGVGLPPLLTIYDVEPTKISYFNLDSQPLLGIPATPLPVNNPHSSIEIET
jgi:hypothetical protein